ncbi:MAG: S8 family serine peptidase [Bacteroidaceae bacterium]|nr:S8 family serine peptidase [Bacteroidaceae bacterium]
MKNTIIIFLMFFLVVPPVMSQDNDYFYYYNGQKNYLQIDSTSVMVLSNDSITMSKRHGLSLKWMTRNDLSEFSGNDRQRSISTSTVSLFNIPQNISKDDYNIIVEEFKKIKGVTHVLPSFRRNGCRIDATGSIYVKLFSEDDVKLLEQMANDYEMSIVEKNRYMPLWYTLSCVNSSLDPIAAANLFHETKYFEHAEPAFYMYNISQSNDTFYEDQWNLKNRGLDGGISNIDINIESAWNITKGGNVVVALIDNGIDMEHPDLEDNIYDVSFDAVTERPQSVVWGGHGTACAGIIGAIQNNGVGVSGVAPECKLMSISFCNVSILAAYGIYVNEASMLANAINVAWNCDADVISNSWGGGAESSFIDNAISAALTQGRGGLGSVVVFSAGNAEPNGNTRVKYPANSNPDILCVGALSPCGERKNPNSCDGEQWHSCFGSELDIMAPGVLIPTTYINDSGNSSVVHSEGGYYHTAFNGTSAACPHVAGVAALMLKVNPELTVKEVNDLIESTANKVRADLYSYSISPNRTNGTWHNEVGYGLLDAASAVRAARPLMTISDSVKFSSVIGRVEVTGVDVLLENVEIKKSAEVTINAENSITLRPSIKIEKGAIVKATTN